jgi:hypothetical protein
MKETMLRLTVIDNQLADFNYISARLIDGRFDVYPKADDYPNFIGEVRTALNNRYRRDRRDAALEVIYAAVDKHSPAGFVIDFQLVGCHDAETGIYLASLFRIRYPQIPIFFLSRTPFNAKKVKDTVGSVEDTTWLEKGYAGISVSEEDYFTRHILEKIRNKLGENETQRYQARLDFLKKKEMFRPHDRFIDRLAQDYVGTEHKEKAKEYIDRLAAAGEAGAPDSEIKKIIQSYPQ